MKLFFYISFALLLLGSRAMAQTSLPVGTSHFVTTADRVKIHCFDKGVGPAILFVPGWTMPADIWENQIEYFSANFRVVAMDPRSQGRSSDVTEGHYPLARARDIKAVVDELKLAPVVLVGWSLATTELASYVDQFGTDSIAGLVFVEGIVGGDFDPVMTPAMLRMASSFQRDRVAATREFVRGMFQKPQSDDYLNKIIAASLRTPTNSAMALFLGGFTTDNRPVLAKINRPTLIVVAASPLLPTYQDMQRRIRGAKLEVFEHAGHALFVDEPERFNRVLEAFLKQTRQSP